MSKPTLVFSDARGAAYADDDDDLLDTAEPTGRDDLRDPPGLFNPKSEVNPAADDREKRVAPRHTHIGPATTIEFEERADGEQHVGRRAGPAVAGERRAARSSQAERQHGAALGGQRLARLRLRLAARARLELRR